jgi:hypothetical protein
VRASVRVFSKLEIPLPLSFFYLFDEKGLSGGRGPGGGALLCHPPLLPPVHFLELSARPPSLGGGCA